MPSKTFVVPNISCGHCVGTVERELNELEGVSAVQASPITKEVTVEWDETRASWEDIEGRLEEIHYPPAV